MNKQINKSKNNYFITEYMISLSYDDSLILNAMQHAIKIEIWPFLVDKGSPKAILSIWWH